MPRTKQRQVSPMKDKVEKYVIAYENICNKIKLKKEELKDLENKKKETESKVLSLVLAENALTLVDVLVLIDKYKISENVENKTAD